MEIMVMFWLIFMAEANLNKEHQVLTYLMLLFFPKIMSWLLTKLVEVSHVLMRNIGSGTTCTWQSVTTPGSTARKRKQDNQARSRTKYERKGSSHLRTSYLWPSLSSMLIVESSTPYAASRWPSPYNACPNLLPLPQPLTYHIKSPESASTPTPLSLALTHMHQSR
jgi:hypothetical protein